MGANQRKPAQTLPFTRDAEGSTDLGRQIAELEQQLADLKRQQAGSYQDTSSDEFLRLQAKVLESMAEGVSVTDESGVILYTNPAEDLMFGYERGELLGKHLSVQGGYEEDENARRVTEVLAVLQSGRGWKGEWLNRRKDGTFFYTYTRISPAEANGRRHWVCVQQDITERKHYLRNFRDTAERLNLALTTSGMGDWSWDSETDVATLSDKAAGIFGIRAGVQVRWSDMQILLHPDDRERARLELERVTAERADYDSNTGSSERDARAAGYWRKGARCTTPTAS